MANVAILEALLDSGAAGRTLKKDTDDKGAVKVLQEMLFSLGFGKALNWDKFGPDGDYGKSTTAAVAKFAKANGVASDGTSVSAKLCRLILQRYAFLDEMRHMQDAVNNSAILKQLRFKANAPVAISVLQTILFELGFGEEMNWEKFGADGEYGNGTVKAVLAYCEREGISSDGMSVTLQMAKKCLTSFKPFYGPGWYKETPKIVQETLTVSRTNKKATVSDGIHTKTFTKFRRGYYTLGDVKTAKFIDDNRAMLRASGMSDSALNVMLGVSENEGNIDAINTWDNAIMTFGLFQWTVGVANGKGELAALFKKIKEGDPEVFEECYGRHGIGVASTTTGIRGHLTLHGRVMDKASEKAVFRDPKWCFWFWKAGQHPVVQRISVEHAFSRIGVFARSSGYRVNGHDVADVITSEYGMALVVDNHVNRPAYIAKVLTNAVVDVGLANSDPKDWGTAEERKVIARYVKLRETFGKSPMTDARKRAQVTKRYLTKGIISDERGSFVF